MRSLFLLLLGLLLVAVAGSSASSAVIDETRGSVSRIAFGSCSKAHLPQPLWRHIVAHKPEVWVWLGDNVYADKRVAPGWFQPARPEAIRTQYEMQLARSGYRQLLKTNLTVAGTWDDHDYGLNDAGKEFEDKDASQQLLLDFLGENERSPRRKRRGVYSSYLFSDSALSTPTPSSPAGTGEKEEAASAGDRSVKLLMLDTRYHRGVGDVSGGDGDMLGVEQWAWLEEQLNDSAKRGVKVTLIATSVQFLADLRLLGEGWSYFALSKHRLLSLIRTSGAEGVVLLSGDVHHSEILRLDAGLAPASAERRGAGAGGSSACLGYPLYEVTSSGLTHALDRGFGKAMSAVVLGPFANSLSIMNNPQKNYGFIEMDWESEDPSIGLYLHGEDGQIIFDQVISLAALRNSQASASAETCSVSGGCCTIVDDIHRGAQNSVMRAIASKYMLLLGMLVLIAIRMCCFSSHERRSRTQKRQ